MSGTPPSDPVTVEEWIRVAHWAYALLVIDSARQYGLMTGGPEIDEPRCEEIVARAKRMGIKIDKEKALRDFVAAWNAEDPPAGVHSPHAQDPPTRPTGDGA